MFLPEISESTMKKYVDEVHEKGEPAFVKEILGQIQNENPGLFKIIELSVRTALLPGIGTLLLTHHCMQYKLLRMQAEDDLMSRLFKDEQSD